MIDFKAPLPNAFERALATFAPGIARERYRNRVAFSYEGARISRLRDTPQHNPNPENASDAYSRVNLLKQVRDLCENSVLFQSILTKLGNYALGEVRWQAKTEDREWNKKAERIIAEWSRDCDVSGRFSFQDHCRIALYSVLRDGDYFWHIRTEGGMLKLQGIESDRVGGANPITKEGESSGVIYDVSTGKPTAYRVFRRTAAGNYAEGVEVSANEIVPFFDHLRYDQYRGISKFAPVITTARDLKELMEATRIGVKFENYHGAIAYSERGQSNDPIDFFASGPSTNINGANVPEFKLEPGVVKHLPNTSRMDFLKSDRPSGQWQSYVRMLVKEILQALDLPEGFGWDLAGLGGPAARMDAAQAYRKIRYLQNALMVPRMDRVTYLRLMQAFADGELEYRDDWKARAWQFPAMPTIDVGRDSAAGINEVRAGLLSKADWFAESGQDGDEEEATIGREATALIERAKAISAETGFPVERVVDMLDMRIQNGTPAIALPSEGGGNAQPLISTIGIGGTQALTEIIAKVGTGELTVEAARAMLGEVFGLGAEVSARMIPDAAAKAPAVPVAAPVTPVAAPAPSGFCRVPDSVVMNDAADFILDNLQGIIRLDGDTK